MANKLMFVCLKCPKKYKIPHIIYELILLSYDLEYGGSLLDWGHTWFFVTLCWFMYRRVKFLPHHSYSDLFNRKQKGQSIDLWKTFCMEFKVQLHNIPPAESLHMDRERYGKKYWELCWGGPIALGSSVGH